MIKSMTGFSAMTREDDRVTVAVTIRSVNHRHLDVQVRLPHALAALEPEVRALVGRHVARGRVEVSVSLQLRHAPAVEVELDEAFCAALSVCLDRARARGLVSGPLTPGDLLRLPQALTIRDRQIQGDHDDETAMIERARTAISDALADLDTMRSREGDQLRADLDERRTGVARLVDRIAAAADLGRAGMEQRLAARVRELRVDLQADEVAIAQEIVKIAARSDISEEVERFRGHVAHWADLADGAEPCGRKLDFLLQEMNREVNTMGSKADGLRVSELIIAAKAELERMREQVQNAE
jgi:uncharacterized protein (TIGR00255 family)